MIMNLLRTTAASFTIGLGATGVRLKNNGGVLEAKNDADSAFAVLRAGPPSGTDDVVTKAFGDTYYTTTGARRSVVIPLAQGASTSSTLAVPDGCRVRQVAVDVTTLYDNGATLQVGITGTTNKFADVGDFDMAVVGLYIVEQMTLQSGSAETILATIANTPTAGAATLIVEFEVSDV
jgi:hypothetical protein